MLILGLIAAPALCRRKRDPIESLLFVREGPSSVLRSPYQIICELVYELPPEAPIEFYFPRLAHRASSRTKEANGTGLGGAGHSFRRERRRSAAACFPPFRGCITSVLVLDTLNMVARNCIGAGRRALPALALAVALFGLSAPAALAQPGAQSMNPVSATGIAFGPQTVFLGPVGQAAPTTLAATATQVAQTGTIESTPAIAATGTVQSIQAVSTGTAMLPANSATSMAPQVQTSAAGSAPQVTATSSATQQQQQQQQQTTSTSGIVPNGAPVQTIPPKTLVIYVTTTESIPSRELHRSSGNLDLTPFPQPSNDHRRCHDEPAS